MKKFLMLALVALLVLSLSVIAFAEEEEEASGITAEDLNASENPGVEFEVIESDGTSVTFDVKVKDGYMVDDTKLNDGNVAVPDVYLAKVNPSTGVQTMTKIAKNAEGYYKVAKFVVGDDRIVVDHVTPIAITIDGKNTKDDKMTIYPDGHTYIFKNFANNGTIEIVNCKTDYTKVLDGAYVDDFNHIIHMSEETSDVPYNSYFPDVQITGTFTNNGTIKVRYGIGQNGADRVLTLNLTPNAAAGNFVNNGEIIVPARVSMNVNTFTNNGYIEVTHGVHVSNVNAQFNVTAPKGFINNGEIKTEHGTITIGTAAIKTDLINNAKINFSGTITVNGVLKNEATGEMVGTYATYANEITGAAIACNPTLTLNQLYDAKNNITSNYNKGLLSITTRMEEAASRVTAFTFYGEFKNYATVKLEGNRFSVEQKGMLINYAGADFTYLSYTPWTNTDGSSTYNVQKYWQAHAYIEVEGESSQPAPIAVGIQNYGDMYMDGYYMTNFGKTQNYGNMTLAFRYAGFGDEMGLEYKEFDEVRHITADGRFYNYEGAVLNIGAGRVNFTYLKNDGEFNLLNESIVVVGEGTDGDKWLSWNFYGPNTDDVYYDGTFTNGVKTQSVDDYVIDSKGVINLLSGAKLYNFDTINVNGEMNINAGGIVVNFDNFNLAKNATLVNEGTFKNGDPSFKIRRDNVAANMEYLVEIYGQFINKNTLFNNAGSTIRIEKTGKLDNTEGFIQNLGMIINVGEFISTVEGIDNQFAIHGYEVEYTNKASECTCDEHTAAPADDTKAPETKAPETKAPETKAPDTKKPAETEKPNKTPAAQTSDVAVAGFAVIATLALAGVVVAKKVR